MRVLVIEDNANSYMLLQETLDNWSVDVSMASSAKLVADRMHDSAVRGKPFEVVLLDHSLPDATTEELLRTIRLDPVIGGTFVVLMSALDYNPIYDGTRVIAPDMCIAKPMGQQLLRGALRASREPRQELSLPTGPTDREATAAAPRDDLPALSLHVLVVDDNAINREVAVAMLTELRCNVEVAEDGRVAVAKAALQRFDVILMDCQMPGMDGYAATEAIREDERQRGLATTAIIALSANVLARDRERCLQVRHGLVPREAVQVCPARRGDATHRAGTWTLALRDAAPCRGSGGLNDLQADRRSTETAGAEGAARDAGQCAEVRRACSLPPILLDEPLLTETGRRPDARDRT